MVKIEKRQADAGYDNSQHNDVSSSSFPPLPSSEGIINNVEDHEENPWRKIHLEQQKAKVASTSTRPREPEYAVAAISRQSEDDDESSDEESEEEAPVFPQANEPAQTPQPEVIPPPDQSRPWTNQLEFMKTKMLPCLLKKKESRQFRQPMTSRYLKPRHYFEAVRYPMDFGTIRRRLNNKYYRSGSECVDDIMRIFKNANIYKPSPSRMSENAQFMETAFRKKMLDMPKVEEEVDVVRAQAKPKKEEEPEVEFDPSDTGRDHRGVSKRARKPVKHYGCNEVNDHPPSTSAQARELERWKRVAALKPKCSSTGEAGASPKAPKRARYSDDQADKAKCDGNEKLRIAGVVAMLHHKVQKLGNEKKEENGEVEQVENVKEQEETTETKMEINRKIKDMKKEKGEPEQVEMNRRIKGMKREKREDEVEMNRKIKDMKKERGKPEVEMKDKNEDMKKEKGEPEQVEMNRKIKDMKKEKREDEVEMNRKIKDMKKEKREDEVEMNRKIKDMKKEKDEVEINLKIKDMKKEKEEDEVEMNRKIKDMKKEKEEDEVEMNRKIKYMKKEKDEVEINRKIKDMKKEKEEDEVEMNRKIKDMKKEEDEDEAEKKDKNEEVEKGNEDSEMEDKGIEEEEDKEMEEEDDKEIKEKKDKEIEEKEEEEGELMDI
ncbi:unnamed protein product [Orchesella dallaii]|uniref:Bromo domain-containing protein n=1 Tax=Orchesella dallaii TaxID=48710 RepID=A0ABP1Q3E2_9HEXA